MSLLTEGYSDRDRDREQEELMQVLRNALHEFFDDVHVKNTLRSIQSGDVGQEGIRSFFSQRLIATSSFEELLQRIIDLSPLPSLTRVVQDNLNDETGRGIDGVISLDKSHATWRKDFYHTLGINEEETKIKQAKHGAKDYLHRIQNLIEDRDVYHMLGALLFFEAMIPREFQYLKKGRDILFPEQFISSSNDIPSVTEKKARARMYLDDHILHDARSHFPDLLKALQDTDEDGLEKIKRGIELAKDARISFYTHWQE